MSRIVRPFRWIASRPLARSLRFRLILLVLLASLPSLGLLFFTASQQRDDAVEQGQEEARRLARLVAADQSNVASQIELVLSTMSLFTELRGDSPQPCSAMLQTLTESSGEPADTAARRDLSIDGASFLQVVVLDNDLSSFCVGPAGSGRIASEDRTLALSALETGSLVKGNYRTSTTGSMVVTYALPMSRADGHGRRVIVATFEIYALAAFAREATLPGDSLIVIFDEEGNLEQTNPFQPGLPVGTSLVGTPAVDSATGRDGADVGTNQQARFNNQDFVFGSDDFWTPDDQGGTKISYAMVAFPKAAVIVRATEKFNENLGKLGIAAIVALVAAWIGADLFVGRDVEARKALIQDLYHSFSTGSIERIDQIVGPGYVDRTPAPGQAEGIDGLRQNIAAFRTAFPQGKVQIRDLIAEHDMVVARVTLSGALLADYFGIPATGKHMVADGVETFRFMHGMVVESWSMFGSLRERNRPVEEAPPLIEEKRGLWRRIFRRKPRTIEKSGDS